MKESHKYIKALTVRGLPDSVADAVSQKAHRENLSFSRALVALLEEQLAFRRERTRKRRDLAGFAGTWSAKEAEEFDAAVKDQRSLDPEMWK